MENLENKILLDDICEQLNKRTSENAKKAYINQVIKIKPHVSYVARDVVAKQIIDAAHFSFPEGIDITNISEDELKNIEKVPKINRSSQYVMSALMLVDLYTNIKINFAMFSLILHPILLFINARLLFSFLSIIVCNFNPSICDKISLNISYNVTISSAQ